MKSAHEMLRDTGVIKTTSVNIDSTCTAIFVGSIFSLILIFILQLIIIMSASVSVDGNHTGASILNNVNIMAWFILSIIGFFIPPLVVKVVSKNTELKNTTAEVFK